MQSFKLKEHNKQCFRGKLHKTIKQQEKHYQRYFQDVYPAAWTVL